MNDKDRELMERYIYQVTRRLPVKQREETGKELRELIEDMCEAQDMESALKKMGDPAEFAQKYRGDGRCLIGPEYYENYFWVLKLVLLCVLVSAIFSGIVQGFLSGGEGMDGAAAAGRLGRGIRDGLINAVWGSFAAFGAVTLLFACLERFQIRLEWRKTRKAQACADGDTGWTPETLAPVPEKKARISRADSLVGILFCGLAGGLFVLAPEFFGIYGVRDGEVYGVPIFNMEKWHEILPILLVGLGIGLIDEAVRMGAGRYCRTVLISNAISSLVQIVAAFLVLKKLPFWNPGLALQVEAAFGDSGPFFGRVFAAGTDVIGNVVLLLIAAASLGELAHTAYCTWRYGGRAV